MVRAGPASTEWSGTVDRAVVHAALAHADLRVLVMCLFHLTGDRAWLEPPYQPVRDVRLIADPAAGFSEETQRTIRETAEGLLADGVRAPIVEDPGPEAFGRMMSVFLGELVPPEYVPLVRQDMGLERGDVRWSGAGPDGTPADVIIVGAGVSGVCLAAKLVGLGIPCTVVERNPEVGGTWFDNRYPGCGVDTPNHLYSYSFAPNPAWRHYFSPRDELQSYVEECATTFGIRSRIRFDTEVIAARWDDTITRWVVTLRDRAGAESTASAAALVVATGHFNQPHDVRFPGADAFSGEMFHSSRWPDDADLTGKRVGVIGTGATAMQVVPTIADEVASLTVFQRTAQWARPVVEYDQVVAPAAAWLFASVPYYARWYRFAQLWRFGDGLLRFLRKDPDWPHPDRSLNKTNDRHRIEMTDYIRTKLASRPELIASCVPDYPPFGKRILIDNGWFDTLCRPDVQLVTEPIDAFEAAGVRTSDGAVHHLDAVILATGFTVTNLAARIDICGRDGRRLAEDWADENPTAHLGMTVPGFPNFFVMFGPNTNMGHGGSGMWLAETQTRYITGCLVAMAERGLAALECREDRRTTYTATIDELHDHLVWTHPGVTTYYRNRHGKVRSPMPFRLVDYWSMTRVPDLEDFVVTPTPEQPTS